MEKDYLVFWVAQRAGHERRASIAHVVVPPCEPPRGADLEEVCKRAIPMCQGDYITGIVELGTACWSPGAVREIALGNGKVASIECHSRDGWKVHA